MRMREGAEIARAPSLGDWGSPLGGSSTHGTPSSLRAVSPLPRGNPLLERSLRVAGHPWVMPEMGPLIYASLPRLYAAPPPRPKLTTFVSRSSAGSQPRSRGPQQSRQTSARQR